MPFKAFGHHGFTFYFQLHYYYIIFLFDWQEALNWYFQVMSLEAPSIGKSCVTPCINSHYYSDTPWTSLCIYQYLISTALSLAKLHVRDFPKLITEISQKWGGRFWIGNKLEKASNSEWVTKFQYTEQQVPDHFYLRACCCLQNLNSQAMISFSREESAYSIYPLQLPLLTLISFLSLKNYY